MERDCFSEQATQLCKKNVRLTALPEAMHSDPLDGLYNYKILFLGNAYLAMWYVFSWNL